MITREQIQQVGEDMRNLKKQGMTIKHCTLVFRPEDWHTLENMTEEAQRKVPTMLIEHTIAIIASDGARRWREANPGAHTALELNPS
jgi:hypothetical protein